MGKNIPDKTAKDLKKNMTRVLQDEPVAPWDVAK